MLYLIGEIDCNGKPLYEYFHLQAFPADADCEARLHEVEPGNPRRLVVLASKDGRPKELNELLARYEHLAIFPGALWFKSDPAIMGEFL